MNERAWYRDLWKRQREDKYRATKKHLDEFEDPKWAAEWSRKMTLDISADTAEFSEAMRRVSEVFKRIDDGPPLYGEDPFA